MKIKKEFLNKKSLKPYGFKQEVIDAKRGIYEYTRGDEYATTLIQRCDGDITIVMPDDEEGCGYYDSTNIPDVVYHLIKDGLVEAEELKKEFADIIVSRIKSDIRDYDKYIFYPPDFNDFFNECFEEAQTRAKETIVSKLYDDMMNAYQTKTNV